jgi:hypothetical protein
MSVSIRSDNDVKKADKAVYDKARRERLGQEWIDHSMEWIRNNREKHRQYCKNYRQANQSKEAKRHADAHQKERRAALSAYGGACVCCGESQWEFLAIDHMNGGGNKHRDEVGRGAAFFVWLRKAGYPKEGFQVLCHNCNQAKQYSKVCPHK